MKKHLPMMIAAAAGLVAANALAAPTAEQLAGSFNVNGFVDYVKAGDDTEVGGLGDGTGLGADLGYRFNELIGVRARYEYLDINRHDGADRAFGDMYGVDLLYYPLDNIYFAVGARQLELDDRDSEGAANLGVGFNYFFTKNISVSPEVNFLLGEDNRHLTTGVGLNYHFGVKEPAKAEPAPVVAAAVVAEAPKDSDGDGVYDDKDQCPDTPAGDKVDENGCTIFAEKTKTVRLEVLFANDSAVIPANSYGDIAKVGEFMQTYPHVDVTIEGHTSAPGSDKHNMKLSQARADAVATALTSRYGIDSQRVKAIGYGETRLLDKANTAEAHKINRRVQAVLEVSERYSVKK